ncbi:hypothetical protein HY251_09555, partial [bacterium]|nr:hypothetical protein [bacterium]
DATLLTSLLAFQFDADEGHPTTRATIRNLHPLARILSICEAYDALVGPAPGHEALRPDRAFARLLEGRPRAFDPRVVAAFARLVGTYPPGTPVRLNTGEEAIVARPGEVPDRPVVAIQRGPKGEDGEGALLDLGLLEARGHRIAGAID